MMLPVLEVGWKDRVRPKGWHAFHATLDVEDVAGGWVKVLWRCDPSDRPVGPFTMFRRFETLEVD